MTKEKKRPGRPVGYRAPNPRVYLTAMVTRETKDLIEKERKKLNLSIGKYIDKLIKDQ